jgi:hypothetical protein
MWALSARGEERGEELVILVFVEVDRELRDGLVRAGIGLVIENMHGVVSNLQKIDIAGDRARRPTRREFDAISISSSTISSSVTH